MDTKRCKRCKRELKELKSLELGLGPACYKINKKEISDKEFEKNQITIFEILDSK